MFAQERAIEIIEYLNEKKKVTVPELCERFKVSSATIRNQLNEMEEAGLLIRTHGGAMLKSKSAFELNSKQKEVQYSANKEMIAALAARMVEDGDTIILDSGTTTMELAKLLVKKNQLKIITNDLPIALLFEGNEKHTVMVIGGLLRGGFHNTVGNLGTGMLSGITVDKAFMGVNSISIERGAATPQLQQAEMKKQMVAAAMKVIILCENHKIGKHSFAQFATAEQIDMIITEKISAEEKALYEQAGIDIVAAGE